MVVLSDQTTLTNRSETKPTSSVSRSKYLTALREYQRTTGSGEENIRVGDVMQIHNEGTRSRLSLAVVLRLINENDGSVRAASVMAKNGLTTGPLLKLYFLLTVTSEN